MTWATAATSTPAATRLNPYSPQTFAMRPERASFRAQPPLAAHSVPPAVEHGWSHVALAPFDARWARYSEIATGCTGYHPDL